MKRGRESESPGGLTDVHEVDRVAPGRRGLFSGPALPFLPVPGKRSLTSQLGVQRKAAGGGASDAHERQADEAAAIVVAGGSAAHLANGGATSVDVAKKDEGAPHALAVNAAVAVSVAGSGGPVLADDDVVTLQ